MAAQRSQSPIRPKLAKVVNLLGTRYPEYAAACPTPKPEEIAGYRAFPKVISILDYPKGLDTPISSQFEQLPRYLLLEALHTRFRFHRQRPNWGFR